MFKRVQQVITLTVVAMALMTLWACQGKPTTPTSVPIPTPMQGVPTITDFTPEAGLTKNTQVRGRYFKDVFLWKVPEGRPYTQEDSLKPTETFTKEDKRIGLHIETLDAFVPGMVVTYRLDKRAFRGDGKEVSLSSNIGKPGTYDILIDAPTDAAGYVVRFFLNGILVDNLTFELK
ncbi:MAG: hypothetical protein HY666_00900 [Chloroflexi bacterium]|nr:hypothetical protein [Chloroflexota bacterium]